MLLSQAFVPYFPSSLASIATIRHSFFSYSTLFPCDRKGIINRDTMSFRM